MTTLVSWCSRRAAAVVVLWLVALGGLGSAALHTGAAFRDTIDLPAADSTAAANLLRGNGAGGAEERVVARTPDSSLDTGTGRARLDDFAARLAALPHVVAVTPGGLSADRRTAMLGVRFDAPAADLGQPVADALAAVVRDAHGLTAGAAGEFAAMTTAAPDLGNAGIGLLAAALVLLVTFGSMTCVLLPVLTAAVSVGCALATVTLLSHVMTVPKISTEIAALLGLGVGVDYALFVLTRYRQGLGEGAPPPVALATAAATSGRSVVFAGVTVCVSLGGLLTVGMPFLDGIAVAAAVSVLLTALAALTLLPALLRPVARMRVKPGGNGGRWARLARSVTARPGPYTLAAVLVVAVLALPMTGLRLGVPDAAQDPPGSITRTGAELLTDGFGPGAGAPLLVVGTGDASLGTLREAVLARADAGPPMALPGGGRLLTVVPRTAPGDPATAGLLAWTRTMAATIGGPDAHVGGIVATQADFSAAITARLPVFLVSVVGIAVLLLAWVFRSVLIPLTAAVMNLLTAAATTGAVVCTFGAPIEPYLPVFLFAGLFGLSMDYEVFLIARIQEAWRRHGDTRAAVVDGVAATGRTITAAALIMALVFVSFAFVDARVVREAGVGLTVAVLLDAVVVRCVLVPAVMARFGAANWWFPRRRPVLTREPVGSTR